MKKERIDFVKRAITHTERAIAAAELLIKNELFDFAYNILWITLENLGTIENPKHGKDKNHANKSENALWDLYKLKSAISLFLNDRQNKKKTKEFSKAFNSIFGKKMLDYDKFIKLVKKRHSAIYLNEGKPSWEIFKKEETIQLLVIVKFYLRYFRGGIKAGASFENLLHLF